MMTGIKKMNRYKGFCMCFTKYNFLHTLFIAHNFRNGPHFPVLGAWLSFLMFWMIIDNITKSITSSEYVRTCKMILWQCYLVHLLTCQHTLVRTGNRRFSINWTFNVCIDQILTYNVKLRRNYFYSKLYEHLILVFLIFNFIGEPRIT